ncbi:MAG: YrhK family protein [Nocardiopsaceae bacterium]|nr:YrhK family protein [Nocardiopsaceae bacterium]
MRILDPTLHDLTPRHLEIFWRYQVVRTGVDFSAACCFVIGSIFFFYESLSTPADWLFLIGSILFAVKPTIDMVRSLHLKRLPATAASPPRKA